MKKQNAVITIQLCYAKLNSIINDISKWNLTGLRDADKAEILAIKDRARNLINELDGISTIQLMKMKSKEARQFDNKVNKLIKEWQEVRSVYSQLSTSEDAKLFRVLGIKPTSNWDEIKKAYRAKAKETHPDVVGGSQSKFEKVQNAYEELKARYGK